MKYNEFPFEILNIPLYPEIYSAGCNPDIYKDPRKLVLKPVALKYITFNIYSLDNYPEGILNTISENYRHIHYKDLIIILEWLFAWYKKNDRRIFAKTLISIHHQVFLCLDQKKKDIEENKPLFDPIIAQ